MAETLTVDLGATDHVPDGEPIRTAAQSMLDKVTVLRTTVGDLKQSWSAVPDLYSDTMHDDALYIAFDDPDTDVDQVVFMAKGFKEAADTAADAFDDIRSARNRIGDVDLPAAQTEYETACQGQDPALWWILKGYYETPLQTQADGLATDLETAESDFKTAVDAAMGLRPDREVKANFSYGTRDPAVVAARGLYDSAMAPDATARDLAAYYEHLATLTPEQIEALGAMDPLARTTPPPLPTTEAELATWPGGAEGASWWQGLSKDQQAALVLALPALVGNTQGVPYTDRSAANASVLDLAENDPDLTDAQRGDLEGLREALADIPPGADPAAVRMLLALRVNEEPVLAATSIGNPDTADTTTFSVPGMGAETSGAAGMMDEAQNLYTLTGGDRAVITWIGYDTPDGAQKPETLGASQVLYNDAAYAGGINLAYALDGYAESRAHNADYVAGFPGVDGPVSADPRTNVIAHSYGTPTGAYALTMTEHAVESYTMYGSVGVDPDDVPNAEALNVARDAHGNPEVYATNAGKDKVAVPLGQTLSPLGGEQRISPTDDTFGAKAFSADGNGTSPGEATDGHGAIIGANGTDEDFGYMETGSQSLNSIARIVEGHGNEVPQIDQSPWDDRREAVTHIVMAPDRIYHTFDRGTDVMQDVARGTVDAGQESTNSLIDAAQDVHPFSNPVSDFLIDGGQTVTDSLVDGSQDAVDTVTDWGQDRGEDVHDGIEATGGWLLEKGQGLADKLKPGGIPGL